MKNELPQGTAGFNTKDDFDRECLTALISLSSIAVALIGIGVGIGYLIWG
jgi:hypothetical protein